MKTFNFNKINLFHPDDTTAIANLLQSDQELNINAGFGNSSYYKPIHLATELGKNITFKIKWGNLVN